MKTSPSENNNPIVIVDCAIAVGAARDLVRPNAADLIRLYCV